MGFPPFIRLYGFPVAVFLCLILSFSPSEAACTNPVEEEGVIVYNQDHGIFQGCTAAGWISFNRPTKTPPPPQGCDNIGEVCTGTHAGMIYGGDYNGYRLYVAANDAPTTLNWGPDDESGVGFCTSPAWAEPSCGDGLTNTQFLKNHTNTYSAAEYCASLSVHGYGADQWYLPSRHEFGVIFQNMNTEGLEGVYNFSHPNYWSSSELSETLAYLYNPNTGNPASGSKGTRGVRCILRRAL